VLRGPEHVYEFANPMYLQLVDNRDIVGKPIREALPELGAQGLFEILDEVYTTGKPYIANEIPSKFHKGNGMVEEGYCNFVYQPIHSSEGNVDGIFVHGVDVSEQVLARTTVTKQ
jgi:PAS domain-containing protein